MYTIKKFVADHAPTQYVKLDPIGVENGIEYATYEDAMELLTHVSEEMAKELKPITTAREEAKEAGASRPKETRRNVSYRMYTLLKKDGGGNPVLLHYIDHNYPNIALPSKA